MVVVWIQNPTFFDDDGEEQGFGRNVLPLGNLKPETSISRTLILTTKPISTDDFRIILTKVFLAWFKIPLTCGESLNSEGFLIYENDDDPVSSAGAETNIILIIKIEFYCRLYLCQCTGGRCDSPNSYHTQK